jgi:hypothetical protein
MESVRNDEGFVMAVMSSVGCLSLGIPMAVLGIVGANAIAGLIGFTCSLTGLFLLGFAIFMVVEVRKRNRSKKMDADIASRDECECGICKSNDVAWHLDIGWDIYEGGEERQHADECRACGATRYWSEHTDPGLDGAYESYGVWRPKRRA